MIRLGVIASMETRHFSFEAHGLDEEDARRSMLKLLEEHARQCGMPPHWHDQYETRFRDFVPGTGYRDGEIMA